MDKIKIRFDPTSNTLTIWFDDPQEMAYLSPIEEETPGEFHFIKNDAEQVIGLECQFYQIPPGRVALEIENAQALLKEFA